MIDEKRLLEACFSLAEDLMWEKTTSPLEKLPEQMDELSVMTENFVSLSKKNFYQVENLSDGQEILIGAYSALYYTTIPLQSTPAIPLQNTPLWCKFLAA